MCRRWPRDSAETRLYFWHSSWGVWKHRPQLCCRVIIPGNSSSGKCTQTTSRSAYSLFWFLFTFCCVELSGFLQINWWTSPNRKTSPATLLITLLCNIWDTLARDIGQFHGKSQLVPLTAKLKSLRSAQRKVLEKVVRFDSTISSIQVKVISTTQGQREVSGQTWPKQTLQ